MCLAVPARIIAVDGAEQATVSLGGVRLGVSTALLDEVTVGDFVIVHVGYAIGRMDAEEAERTLAALAALAPEERAEALTAAERAAGLSHDHGAEARS